MRLGTLLEAAGIACPCGKEDISVTSIVTDSRKAVRGSMFICIEGLRYDGHKFIKNALDAGASVIIARHVRDDCVGGAAIVSVDNTRRAAALLYNAWYGDPAGHLKMIGVTGTNGKTTVSFMIRRLLERSGLRCGLIGTLGAFLSENERIDYPLCDPLANMTTPDAEGLYFALSKMAERGIEYAVMEVSSHALSMCRTDAIFFDTAVFTNLTQDHLDLHGSMEEYFLAKKKLFYNCRRAIINIDDPYGKKIFEEFPKGSIACSRVGKGTFFSLNERLLGTDGVEFTARGGGEDTEIRLLIPGGFTVMNALEAFAAASGYIENKQRLAEIFPDISGVPGRLEKIPTDADFCAYIDYAHTPDALENLLRTAQGFRKDGERIVLLFGCGGERDRGKRREMAQIASRFADLIIVTSDNSRGEDKGQIFSDIMRGIDKEKPHLIIEDRGDAIKYAVSHARAKDIILLAGKGHEKYEIDSGGRRYFNEREIVLEALKDRRIDR